MPQPGTIWLTFFPRMRGHSVGAVSGHGRGDFLAVKGDDLMPPTPEWFRWFAVINWVTGFAILLSLFAVISGIRIWFRPHTRWITMVKFTLVGAAACVSLLAVHYHLIGPARRI